MTAPGPRLLDRYVAREWLRIFGITVIGFPVFTVLVNLTDNIDRYLSRGVATRAIAQASFYTAAEQVFFVIPAAVLFATVFAVGAFSRHTEITAAKASGVPFHRFVAPVFLLALLAAGLTYVVGEIVPLANARKAELLGEKAMRSQTARYNFVYRADGGRTYSIRQLMAPTREMQDVQIEREGSGDFPGYFITATRAVWDTTGAGWSLRDGALRLFLAPDREVAFTFRELRQRALVESPTDLLSEPKDPDEMSYQELGRFIRSLERSGSDANKLKVERALKIAIPVTCLVIALFGAPLGLTGPRAGAAQGVAVSLATTIVFLLSVQIAKGIGAGGGMPPMLAAWLPNAVFGTAGLVLFLRARS